MLILLLKRGPSAEGIFRKPGNAKRLREIKDQLDRGVEVDLEMEQTTLLAALLKVGAVHDFFCLIMGSQEKIKIKKNFWCLSNKNSIFKNVNITYFSEDHHSIPNM